MDTGTTARPNHLVVSQRERIAASRKLPAQEKEFTRMRDQLSQLRRDLPWTRVEKEYPFEGPEGWRSQADLFNGRTQLIVYDFM
ncbi:MAG TPA: DUF899 family protein, partial [Chthonomonadales bacterium]|nr:DUF899 family protein [Chthonomonadales bacterium]